jgi:hypothetical protein
MADQKEGWTDDDEFDWDEVSSQPPPQAETGLYAFKVVESKSDKTSGGHPGVKLTIELTSKYGGGEIGYMSRKVRDTVALTKDAAFRVKQLAKATSVKPPPRNNSECMRDFAEALLGAEGLVHIRKSKGRGEDAKEYANVGMYCTPAAAEDIAKGGDGTGRKPAGGAGAETRPAARQPRTRGVGTAPAAT